MGQWVEAQGRPNVTKISKTCPHCDVTSRKPHRKRKNFFFSMSTRRLAESVEGLNSILALAAGDLWSKKGRPIAVVKGLIDLCQGWGTYLLSRAARIVHYR